MSNEVARRPEIDLPGMLELATTLLKSGFLPRAIETPAQAVAIILAGREIGIPEMQSLRSINVIQGQPSPKPELMLALAYRDIPGFRHKVLLSNEKECRILFTATGREPHTETFTWDQASKMQTKENGKMIAVTEKFNWRTMPKIMLQWRAVSAGMRIFAPDAAAGMAYTPEELGAEVDEHGDVVVTQGAHTRPLVRKSVALPAPAEVKPVPIEPEPMSRFAASLVTAKAEIGDPMKAAIVKAAQPPPPSQEADVPVAFRKFLEAMAAIKKEVGDEAYYFVLGSEGFEHANQIKDRVTQVRVYMALKDRPPMREPGDDREEELLRAQDQTGE